MTETLGGMGEVQNGVLGEGGQEQLPVLLWIGEVAELTTGASRRSLRYYEQQGLMVAERDRNGYRLYPRLPLPLERDGGSAAQPAPRRLAGAVPLPEGS